MSIGEALVKRTLRLLLVLVVAASIALAGCGDDSNDSAVTSSTTGGSASTTGHVGGTITVSAATSLKAAFTEIAEEFEAAHHGVEVTLNFDASSALATQIIEGAPADVFASADEANMTKLADAKLLAGTPETFARNELVIVTKPGNPAKIKTLGDLAGAGVISLCGQEVPCGKYAKQALDNAAVTIDESKVTRGQNVGATLTAVTEGDAVAGIVYATDAASAGASVETVTIPSSSNVIASYPIGVLAKSAHADTAEAFKDFVLGEEGQSVLVHLGFKSPK